MSESTKWTHIRDGRWQRDGGISVIRSISRGTTFWRVVGRTGRRARGRYSSAKEAMAVVDAYFANEAAA